MTIFTKGGTIRSGFVAEDLPTPWTTHLGAVAEDVLERSPMASIDYLGEEMEADRETPWLTKEEAETVTADLPYKVDIPDDGISWGRLDMVKDKKYSEMIRTNLIENAPSGFVSGGLGFGTALLTSFADPLNIALGFIPIVGQARYANMLAKAGVSPLARAGVRLRVGAIEGAAGAAIAEPIIAYSAQKQQSQYGALDSVMAIGFGSLFGGGLHMGTGAVMDKLVGAAHIQKMIDIKKMVADIKTKQLAQGKVELQMAISQAIKTSEPMTYSSHTTIGRIGKLPHESQVQLGQSALGNLLSDTEVNVDPLLRIQELQQARRKGVSKYGSDDEVAVRDEVIEDIILGEQERKSQQRISAEDKAKFGKKANALREQIADMEGQLKELSGKPMSKSKRKLVETIKQKNEELATLRYNQKMQTRVGKVLARRIKEAKEGKLSTNMQRAVDAELNTRMQMIRDMEQMNDATLGREMASAVHKMKVQEKTAGKRLNMPDAEEVYNATVSRSKEDIVDEMESSSEETTGAVDYLAKKYGVDPATVRGSVDEDIKMLESTTDNFDAITSCMLKEAA